MTEDGTHRDFEAAHGRSRAATRIRLKAYVPYVAPLLTAGDLPRAALDLGCGRGEWLELIAGLGFAGQGVDVDAEAARSLGLDVLQGDALTVLRGCETGTYGLVTGFHLVEWLPGGQLSEFLGEIRRVLAPGGLSILETANPENLEVATLRQSDTPNPAALIPPDLLYDLARDAGFAQVCLRRLNESPLVAGGAIGLDDVFDAVSPDYAIIAQVDGPEEAREPLRALLARSHGLRRAALAQRFEERLATREQLTDLALKLESELHHVRHAHATLLAGHRAAAARLAAIEQERAPVPLTERALAWRDWLAEQTRALIAPPPSRPALPPPPSPLRRAKAAPAKPPARTRQAERIAFGSLPDTLTWQMEGPFDSSYSLALVNRELARGLSGQGVAVQLVSADGPGPLRPNADFLDANPDLQAMAARRDAAQIVTRNMYPPRVDDIGEGLAGLHNYAWEETGLPEHVVTAFNRHLRFMTVCSEHVRKVMIDNGVALPITVVGNGVDHLDDVGPEALPEGAVPAASRVFVHVSSCFPRKGADALLSAWAEAFTGDDDVALVVKTFDNPHNNMRRRLRLLEAEYPDMAPVRIICADWTAGQMRSLYRAADVAVFPSRAEGFCLPVAEALLDGCRVLAGGWSGTRVFDGCPLVTFLGYRMVPANTHLGAEQSLWAEPDRPDLVRRLRELRNEAPPDQETLAAARAWLMRRFRWTDVADRNIAAVRQAAATETRWPKVGWVSTFNSRCGIATYSQHLIAHIGAEVHVLAPRGAKTVVPDTTLALPVTRCWTDDGRDPLEELFETIDRLGLETVVLQFNYAFYDFESLGRLIHRLCDAGRQVVLTMHGTDDAKAPGDRQIADIRDALERCARLLVHKRTDLERLAGLGLTENVTVFPHGVLPGLDTPPVVVPLHRAGRPVRIGCYGFLLANKGLPELIEAVALLRAERLDVRLHMLNAEYPKEESRLLRERCAKLIMKRHLAPFVTLDTRFRRDEDVLSDLGGCDLVVFPYQQSAESASGAVRYGLTAGRPVAVTPLPIFSDVSEVTLSLPGRSAEDMAKGLAEIVDRMRGGEDFSSLIARAQNHCAARSYTRLGPQLHDMLMGLALNR